MLSQLTHPKMISGIDVQSQTIRSVKRRKLSAAVYPDSMADRPLHSPSCYNVMDCFGPRLCCPSIINVCCKYDRETRYFILTCDMSTFHEGKLLKSETETNPTVLTIHSIDYKHSCSFCSFPARAEAWSKATFSSFQLHKGTRKFRINL